MPEHVMSRHCWCRPHVEEYPDADLIIHRGWAEMEAAAIASAAWEADFDGGSHEA